MADAVKPETIPHGMPQKLDGLENPDNWGRALSAALRANPSLKDQPLVLAEWFCAFGDRAFVAQAKHARENRHDITMLQRWDASYHGYPVPWHEQFHTLTEGREALKKAELEKCKEQVRARLKESRPDLKGDDLDAQIQKSGERQWREKEKILKTSSPMVKVNFDGFGLYHRGPEGLGDEIETYDKAADAINERDRSIGARLQTSISHAGTEVGKRTPQLQPSQPKPGRSHEIGPAPPTP